MAGNQLVRVIRLVYLHSGLNRGALSITSCALIDNVTLIRIMFSLY